MSEGAGQPVVYDMAHQPLDARGQPFPVVLRVGDDVVDGQRLGHPTRTDPAMPSPSREPTAGIPTNPSSPILARPTIVDENADGGPTNVVIAMRICVPTRIPVPSSQTLPSVCAGRCTSRMCSTTARRSALRVLGMSAV